MSNVEQTTLVGGRIVQMGKNPTFFITKIEDIDASEAMGRDMSFPNTSLAQHLKNLSIRIDNMGSGLIAVTNFKFENIPSSIVESGSDNTVRLMWTTNRTPTAIELKQKSINGEEEIIDIDPNKTSYTAYHISEQTSWSLTVYENENVSLTKTITLFFNKPIYYGMIDFNADSTGVESLTKRLMQGQTFNFRTNPSTLNETACIVIPSEMSPTISINGIIYNWRPINSIEIESSETAYDYTIWCHPQIIQHTITINVEYS